MNAAAVIYVKHLSPMRTFYATCFGLEVSDSAEDYCVLVSDTWTLSLVVVPDAQAATIQISVPPLRRAATPIKLGFGVSSIEGLRPLMEEFGGRLDAGETAWEVRNVIHCDCVDPEGNVVQLHQPVR